MISVAESERGKGWVGRLGEKNILPCVLIESLLLCQTYAVVTSLSEQTKRVVKLNTEDHEAEDIDRGKRELHPSAGLQIFIISFEVPSIALENVPL